MGQNLVPTHLTPDDWAIVDEAIGKGDGVQALEKLLSRRFEDNGRRREEPDGEPVPEDFSSSMGCKKALRKRGAFCGCQETSTESNSTK